MTSDAGPTECRSCRSCRALVRWERTRANKLVPVDVATGRSHYLTCNQPDRWSKTNQPTGDAEGQGSLFPKEPA